MFLCFLSGNDFLPHMDAMRITDDAILRIIDVYKRLYVQKKPQIFITDSGRVDIGNLLPFLHYFSTYERSILLKSEENEKRRAGFRK